MTAETVPPGGLMPLLHPRDRGHLPRWLLVMFGVDTARNEPRTFVAMILAGVIATVLEFAWKARRDARPPLTTGKHSA